MNVNISKAIPLARQKASGFTLIELLVVIGIIVFLAALLIPALSSQMANARRLKCASNLREIGAQTMSYTADNDMRLPVPAGNNLGRHFGFGLIDMIGEYPGGDMKAYYCPDSSTVTYKEMADRPESAAPPNNRFHATGYYWTQTTGTPFFLNPELPHKLISLSPTKGVLAMCLHFPGIPVHGKRVNVLFADGHVELLKGDQEGVLLNYVSAIDFELKNAF